MIFLLDDSLQFPDPQDGEEDGLLAVGGDLSPERLTLAYSLGIFPWFSEGDPILWFCPKERCVIFPDQLKVSKSLAQSMRNSGLKITWNTAFKQVIKCCSEAYRVGQDGTWITEDMQDAYLSLHQLGRALSIEVWDKEELVGGLYGVKNGAVFCGESMFSKRSDASKMAMVSLCRSQKFQLIDCQLPNDHLMRMGAQMISYEAFKEYL